MNQIVTDMSFEDMLHDDSDVFYNYRYFYEPDVMKEIGNSPARVQFLRVLAMKLCAFLNNRLYP